MNDDVAHDKMKFEANNSQGESDPPTKVTGYVNIIIWMWPSHNDVKVANATAERISSAVSNIMRSQ